MTKHPKMGRRNGSYKALYAGKSTLFEKGKTRVRTDNYMYFIAYDEWL